MVEDGESYLKWKIPQPLEGVVGVELMILEVEFVTEI